MKKKNYLNGEYYVSCEFVELHITDVPEIILKDRESIIEFNLTKGYSNVIIGTDKLIDYIMCNLDKLHQFKNKLFIDIDGFGSVVFEGIYIMWKRRID